MVLLHRPTFDDLRMDLSSMLSEERAQRAAAARRAQRQQKQRCGSGQPQQSQPDAQQQQQSQLMPEQWATLLRQATQNDSIPIDAQVSAAAAADAAAEESSTLMEGEVPQRDSLAGGRASESSTPQRQFSMEPADQQRRPMPR